MHRFNPISADFKIQNLVRVDPALLYQSPSRNNDENFPFRIMPMLALHNSRSTYVHTDLTTFFSSDEFGRAEGKTPQRPTDEERATQMKIREAREQIRNEQMKQILTPEQFEKYLKFNEEQKARMRNRAPGHRNHHGKEQ